MSVTRRLVIALTAVLGLAFAAGGALAGSAQAAPYANHVTCSVNVSNPAPGGTITIACTGAHANVTLTIILHSKGIVLGTITTDSSGTGSTSVTLPSGITGHHVLLIRDPLGGTAAIPINIGGGLGAAGAHAGSSGSSGGDTALTGVAVIGIAALGVLLLVGGGLLLLTGRRKTTT
jgi:hypothetical protein